MKIRSKYPVRLIAVAGALLFASCTGAAATPMQSLPQQPAQQRSSAAVQPGSPPSTQLPAQNPVQQNAGPVSVSIASAVASPPVLSNRIDVVYFHANVRCVTCLCFEKEVTNVIKTYFQDALNSGNLTYRILNIQEPKNAGIAKKYGAIGSQLFINTVTNDFDNIEDIQDIWSWNCVDNPAGFDMRVKNIVELRLKGQR